MTSTVQPVPYGAAFTYVYQTAAGERRLVLSVGGVKYDITDILPEIKRGIVQFDHDPRTKERV